MREIEFRAWDNHDKIMLYCPSGPVGEYSFSRPAGYGAIELIPFKVVYYQLVWPQPKGGITFYDPPRYELMQYTRLKGKEGAKIYEGDVVHYERPLTFENGEHGTWQGGNREVKDIYNTQFPRDDAKYVEVIGNIYQNPDLFQLNNLQEAA